MAKPTIEDAIELALKAHHGQKDKYDKPYILHPLRLMAKMTTDDERMVAVLHDVVEDSETTLDDLRSAGYSKKIVDAVDALTRRENEAYTDYVLRAKANPLARRVKQADLEDNMDIRRLPEITEKDCERLQRYRAAWDVITDSHE